MNYAEIAANIRRLKAELAQARQLEKATRENRRQAAQKLEAYLASVKPALEASSYNAKPTKQDGISFGFRFSNALELEAPELSIEWLKEHAPEFLKITIRLTDLKKAFKKSLAVPGMARRRHRRFFVRVY